MLPPSTTQESSYADLVEPASLLVLDATNLYRDIVQELEEGVDAAVCPSVSWGLQATGAGGDVAGGDHGARQAQGRPEDGNAAPLLKQSLHAPDHARYLWWGIQKGPISD